MGEEQSTQLEIRLKNILQISVETLKPKLKSKAQMAQLQDMLIDYQNNQQLAQIIENVLKLNQKLSSKIMINDQGKNMVEEEEYVKLETAVQFLQAKQRAYIKTQNQFKLYCQELEARIKQLEASKNQLVVNLKRDNQSLIEKIKILNTNNRQQKITQLNLNGNPNRLKHKETHESLQKLPKQLRGNEKAQSSLRSKLEQYQQVIQSIEASRGRKHSMTDFRDKMKFQIK